MSIRYLVLYSCLSSLSACSVGLVGQGERRLTQLIKATQAQTRLSAVKLAAQHPRRFADALQGRLHDSDIAVRLSAAMALDPAGRGRQLALRLSSKTSPAETRALALHRLATVADPGLRRRVGLVACKSKDPRVLVAVAALLRNTPADGCLRRLLRHDHKTVRRSAARVLARKAKPPDSLWLTDPISALAMYHAEQLPRHRVNQLWRSGDHQLRLALLRGRFANIRLAREALQTRPLRMAALELLLARLKPDAALLRVLTGEAQRCVQQPVPACAAILSLASKHGDRRARLHLVQWATADKHPARRIAAMHQVFYGASFDWPHAHHRTAVATRAVSADEPAVALAAIRWILNAE